MSEGQRVHFKTILELWKDQIMKAVDRTVSFMQDEATNLPDPIDQATQEEEFIIERTQRDRERKLFQRITETLTTIDSGKYGYCLECGKEIGLRRLEARPITDSCVDCKGRSEQRERQLHG